MGNIPSHETPRVPLSVLQAEIAELNQGDLCQMETLSARCRDTSSPQLENWLFKRCKKYSEDDHKLFFIPITEFSLGYLPRAVRSEKLLNTIKCHASLTVKLLVTYIDKYRPPAFLGGSRPGSTSLRLGTGYLLPPNNDCIPGYDPAKSFIIQTAAHVVFSDDEAARTSVHFFYDKDDDKSNVIKAKGKKITSINKKHDQCTFLCEVKDEREKQEVLKRTRVYRPEVDLMTDFAFTVSHPHGTAKKVSLGRVMSVGEYRKEDVEPFLQILMSECSSRGIHEKKVLYYWFEIKLPLLFSELNKPFEAHHIHQVLCHSEGKGYIQKPTVAEEEILKELHKKQEVQLRMAIMEQFSLRHKSATMTATERKQVLGDLQKEIVSQRSSKVDLPDGFVKLYWEVMSETTAEGLDAVLHPSQPRLETPSRLLSTTRSMTYSLPTCPGTSGANVMANTFRDGKVQMFMSAHSGARDSFVNYSGGGLVAEMKLSDLENMALNRIFKK